jgi:hypothetical protein
VPADDLLNQVKSMFGAGIEDMKKNFAQETAKAMEANQKAIADLKTDFSKKLAEKDAAIEAISKKLEEVSKPQAHAEVEQTEDVSENEDEDATAKNDGTWKGYDPKRSVKENLREHRKQLGENANKKAGDRQ